LVKLSKIEWKTGIASFLFHISVRQFSRIEWKFTSFKGFICQIISSQISVSPIFSSQLKIGHSCSSHYNCSFY